MLSDSHLWVGSFVAFEATVIIVYNVALEPVFIVKLIGAVSWVGGVADVEVRCRNYVLIGVDYRHIDNFSCKARTRVESLYFEAKIAMTLMNLKKGLGKDPVDCEVAMSSNGEEVNIKATDFNFKTRSAVEFV